MEREGSRIQTSVMPTYDEGRENFRVSVRGVCIQEKGCKCALHSRAKAAIDCEARAGDLCGALEIENPRAFGDLPMRPRRKIEFHRRAPAAYLDVRACIVADVHGAVRTIGNRQHEIGEGKGTVART